MFAPIPLLVSKSRETLFANAPAVARFTYEIAPVFILMEHFVLEKMRNIIGFTNGDSILAPGGAISNLYSVIVARHTMFPEYKRKGLRALPKQLVMFTSEHVSSNSAQLDNRRQSCLAQPEINTLNLSRATTRAKGLVRLAALALTMWLKFLATNAAECEQTNSNG